ncbi:MAG: carbohydrate-binding protein [Verrucomicrobia bacterium]|nr:carbohydrate-binding protein [Verrucomicrobiota bacterium]
MLEGTPERVEFFLDDQLRATSLQAPHTLTIGNLAAGIRSIYAKMYAQDGLKYSNVLRIQVGRQMPYAGQPWAIPGEIEAGKYDRFPGAIGQGIAYHDNSPGNAGGFRPEEYVDSSLSSAEGAIVGWTDAGEWLEYTVDIGQSGIYDFTVRFASGNTQQRGPIRLLVNGRDVTGPLALPSTGGWEQFQSVTFSGLELVAGERILRLEFQGGEVNIGRMAFAYTGPLTGDRPIANAGATQIVLLPATTAQLDASQSYVPEGRSAQFEWVQRYGPSTVAFDDRYAATPVISGLVEGFYSFRLILTDGIDEDQADVLLVVSAQEKIAPRVNFQSPGPQAEFGFGVPIVLTATASDVDGEVVSVVFYHGDIRIGTAWSEPWTVEWTPYAEGVYEIHVVAIDDSGMAGVDGPLQLKVTAPLPCGGISPDGNYSYLFSKEGEDYYLTFVPITPEWVPTSVCCIIISPAQHPFRALL